MTKQNQQPAEVVFLLIVLHLRESCSNTGFVFLPENVFFMKKKTNGY